MLYVCFSIQEKQIIAIKIFSLNFERNKFVHTTDLRERKLCPDFFMSVDAQSFKIVENPNAQMHLKIEMCYTWMK